MNRLRDQRHKYWNFIFGGIRIFASTPARPSWPLGSPSSDPVVTVGRCFAGFKVTGACKWSFTSPTSEFKNAWKHSSTPHLSSWFLLKERDILLPRSPFCGRLHVHSFFYTLQLGNLLLLLFGVMPLHEPVRRISVIFRVFTLVIDQMMVSSGGSGSLSSWVFDVSEEHTSSFLRVTVFLSFCDR